MSTTFKVGAHVTMIASAVHPEGLPYALELRGVPNGATWNAQTGVLDWVVLPEHRGTQVLRVIASDGARSSEQIYTLEITDNHPPQLAETRLVFRANNSQTVGLQVTDLDNDPWTVRVESLPEGAIWNERGRAIMWTPRADQVGEHSATLVISDGEAETRVEATWVVEDSPRPQPHWSSFFRPGAGYALYNAGDALGSLHGITLSLVVASWAREETKRGPNRGRTYVDLEILDSSRHGVGNLFSIDVGLALSLERTIARKWLVPMYGLDLGLVFHDSFGTRGVLTPYVALDIYDDALLAISGRVGYRIAPSDMDKLSALHAGMNASFSLW